MSSMFHKPLNKKIADLIPKPKRRYLVPSQPAQPSQPTQPTQPSPATNGINASKPSTSASAPSSHLGTRERVPKPGDPDFVPPGKFVDYELVTADTTNVKYNILAFKKFGPQKVDLDQWRQPINIYRDIPAASKGKGPGNNDGAAASTGGGAEDPDAMTEASFTKGNAGPVRRQQKKTTRVYPVPETKGLNLTPEDKLPYIIEEAPLTINPEVLTSESGEAVESSTTPGQVWIGELDYNSAHKKRGLITFSEATKTFEFAPVHLTYRFSKKRNAVSAKVLQKEYDRKEKVIAQNAQWINRKKMAGKLGPVAVSGTKPSTKNKDKKVSVFRGEVKRQVRASTSEKKSDLFGDDDDDDSAESKMDGEQSRNKHLEDDGYFDHAEYEEKFDDDDDDNEDHIVDEDEAWKMEAIKERRRKEYRSANLRHNGALDDGIDIDDYRKTTKLTEAGRDLKKLVRKREENAAYESESDSDGDPYILEGEEESDSETFNEPVAKPSNRQVESTPAVNPDIGASTSRAPQAATTKPENSKKSSPVAPSVKSPDNDKPSGPALVEEQRPKKKAGKPRAVAAAKSTAAKDSQAQPAQPIKTGTSNTVLVPVSASASTVAIKKRKAREVDEGPSSQTSPTSPAFSKFEENGTAADARSLKKPKGELAEATVIAFLKDKKQVTVGDCVAEFHSYVRDEETKQAFTKMIEKVAYTRGKFFILRKKYAS